MVREVTRWQSNNGRVFDTKEEAEAEDVKEALSEIFDEFKFSYDIVDVLILNSANIIELLQKYRGHTVDINPAYECSNCGMTFESGESVRGIYLNGELVLSHDWDCRRSDS